MGSPKNTGKHFIKLTKEKENEMKQYQEIERRIAECGENREAVMEMNERTVLQLIAEEGKSTFKKNHTILDLPYKTEHGVERRLVIYEKGDFKTCEIDEAVIFDGVVHTKGYIVIPKDGMVGKVLTEERVRFSPEE